MDIFFCDNCKKQIERTLQRYCVKVEVFAAPESPEFTEDDLKKDFKKELKKLVKSASKINPEKLMEDVYVKFEYDMCRKCRDAYLRNLKRISGQKGVIRNFGLSPRGR